jgi:hypothetical protein
MSLLLLFAPRATASAPPPEPQPQPAPNGMSAAAILRAAYRDHRIKQDDKDLAVIVPAVLHLLRGGR